MFVNPIIPINPPADALENIITLSLPKRHVCLIDFTEISLVSKSWYNAADRVKFDLINRLKIEIGGFNILNDRACDSLVEIIARNFYNENRKLRCLKLGYFDFDILPLFVEKIKNKCKDLIVIHSDSTDDDIEKLEKLNLSSLKFNDGYFTSEIYSKLATFKNLTALKFVNNNTMTENDFQKLTNLQNLMKLTVRGIKINYHLEGITKLTNLIKLNFSGTSITDIGLKNICAHLILKDLNIGNCDNISSRGFIELTKLVNLTNLNVNRTKINFEDNLFSKHGKLRHLNLSRCQVSENGIKKIIHLTYLTDLNCGSINSLQLRGIPYFFKNLTALSLACNNLTDDDLKVLPRLPNLEYLNLRFCYYITDKGLEELTNLVKLRSLVFVGGQSMELTSNGVRSLTGLTDLTDLCLESRFVGQFNLIKLKSLNVSK